MPKVKVHKTSQGLIGQFSYENDDNRILFSTPVIPLGTTLAFWLRSDSVSGGKDWLCCKTPKGIVTIWGKVWQAKQSSGPKQGDIFKLTEGKRRKGYRIMAHFNGLAWEFSGPVQDVIMHNPAPDPDGDPMLGVRHESLLDSAINVWVESQETQPWF